MRLLLCGSRDWTDGETVQNDLVDLTRRYRPDDITIVHGGAEGLDGLAGEIAEALGMHVEVYLPNYKAFGPQIAPLLRNTEMVLSGIDEAWGYFARSGDNRGTRDALAKARARGIPVREVEK